MRARDVWRRLRWVLALIGLCALATCPAAQRQCSARRAAREAPELLRYLVDQVKAHAAEHHALPDVDVGPTPPIGTCCADGDTCAPDPSRWADPAWRSLRFSIDGRHRFAYQVHRDGAALLLTAVGDRDCDGVRATVSVRLTLDGDRVVEEWTSDKPLE